jgi:DNA-binding winged helix-turn-helix (wHTH) protein
LKEIRHALGEAGSKHRVVETLRGRGYRLNVRGLQGQTDPGE